MKFVENSNIKFIVILFVTFVSAAEIDICVPSFPQIRDEFDLSAFETEILLGANLLFHCIAALFAGNFGDKYGKKKVINIGFIIFISGSILCFFAPGYYYLLFGRILQGIGISASLVLAPVILMDIYPQEQQQKMMSMFNGFITLAVCLAPTIGSYTTLLFNWRFNFFLLILFGLLAMAIFHYFIPRDKIRNIDSGLSIREYMVVFKSEIASLRIAFLAFFIAVYYTFSGMSSIIYVDSLGVSLETFGIHQGLLTFTFGIVSIFSGSITQKIGKRMAFMVSLVLIVIFLVACLLIIVFNIKNPNYITAAILILSVASVVPVNVIYVLGLASIPGGSGKISGLITIGKCFFTIIGIQTASYYYTQDFRSTGILMLLLETAALTVLFILFKRDPKFYQEVYGIAKNIDEAPLMLSSTEK